MIDEISEDSTEQIDDRLHERASEISQLVISEQELGKLRGVLNPVGHAETRIGSLDKMIDSYRLKALRETDERKERLYKIVPGTAELKSDFIRETETDEEPRYSESQTIIRETIENNENIQDLSRLERFKDWVKKNGIALEGVMIGIAGIITTISTSARNAIKKGDSRKKEFSLA